MSQTCVVNQLKSAAAATPCLAVPTPKSAEQKVHAAPKSTQPPALTGQLPMITDVPCVKKTCHAPEVENVQEKEQGVVLVHVFRFQHMLKWKQTKVVRSVLFFPIIIKSDGFGVKTGSR